MIVIVKSKKYTAIKRYKYKFIGYYLYTFISKIKGYEVAVLKDERIWKKRNNKIFNRSYSSNTRRRKTRSKVWR